MLVAVYQGFDLLAVYVHAINQLPITLHEREITYFISIATPQFIHRNFFHMGCWWMLLAEHFSI